MGKALVLNGVNFSSVSIEKVTIAEEVPCTAIAIDQSSVTLEKVEDTAQLTVTKTPSGTTDEVLWASSDNAIASVDTDGVVTIHGIGTVTITATCGEQTDSLTINQTSIRAQYGLKSVSERYTGPITASGDDKILSIDAISGQYVLGQPYHNDNSLRLLAGSAYDVECVPVPYGASKIKLATSDGVAVSISYTYVVDINDLIEYNSALYPKFLRSQTFVNTATGYAVEYGEAVVFRPVGTSQHDTLSYIYFE